MGSAKRRRTGREDPARRNTQHPEQMPPPDYRRIQEDTYCGPGERNRSPPDRPIYRYCSAPESQQDTHTPGEQRHCTDTRPYMDVTHAVLAEKQTNSETAAPSQRAGTPRAKGDRERNGNPGIPCSSSRYRKRNAADTQTQTQTERPPPTATRRTSTPAQGHDQDIPMGRHHMAETMEP